jgi:integrase/recombinase XerC
MDPAPTFLPSDRLALGALEVTLLEARSHTDRRPALEIVATALSELGVRISPAARSGFLLTRDRDAWLRRLRSGGRSESTIKAYRNAIDDLLAWSEASNRSDDLFTEQGIVDYFDEYRRRLTPAPATYYRRFVLIRRFMQWLSRLYGTPDPFVELEAPQKPRQESDWLTREEFAELLLAAERPPRNKAGLVRRDRLVLLALVITGLRRSELIAVKWRDVNLGSQASVLVRRGKGAKPRRQPLPVQLAVELEEWRSERAALPGDHVFCGLGGGVLHANVLSDIIRRTSGRAGISKNVTAHTLRHTAATWLREATGDARLVAEYLGHADLSTVSRYAHVAPRDLQAAVQSLGEAVYQAPSTKPRATIT